ncbi:MAG: hypothetical protein WBO12_16580, partial [Xanthobacteraceae bacterium]
VKAVRALLDGADSTALNLGTGRGWSVRELVESVRQITGCDLSAQLGARRPGDPAVLIADASRARRQLGWRPQYSDLATQVRHAWTWRNGECLAWKRMQTQPVQSELPIRDREHKAAGSSCR